MGISMKTRPYYLDYEILEKCVYTQWEHILAYKCENMVLIIEQSLF